MYKEMTEVYPKKSISDKQRPQELDPS